MQYALRRFGIDVQDLAALKPFLGPPLRDSFMEFYGMSPEEADRRWPSRANISSRGACSRTNSYPGIPELLAATAAAGRVNVIATSKPRLSPNGSPRISGIDRHFRLISGSTFDGRRKTKADVIRHALSALGIAPGEAVMIGDRRHDVEGAAEEGLPAIAVEWGYAPPASWRRPARYGSSPTSKHCAACCSETNKRLFFSEIFRPDYNPKPHPFGGGSFLLIFDKK